MPGTERERSQPDYRTYLVAYERVWQRYQNQPTEQHRSLLLTGAQLLYGELGKPGRFSLGRAVATPGAIEVLREAGHIPPEFLLRHKHGDWGDLDLEDKHVNEEALRNGQRLLSAYRTRLSDKLWIITEWDRSVTTLLLPDEY
jgi:hypothetical protein